MQRIVGRVKGCASSCPLIRVPYSPSLSSLPCLSCSPSFGASGNVYTNGLECFCIRLHSTRAMTARPTTSRRRRPNTTYVELLESKLFYPLTLITCLTFLGYVFVLINLFIALKRF